MKMPRTEKHDSELRDPLLSALLQEAYADDPAEEDAPGRTERIMRRLLSAGVRPKPSPWFIWSWSAGLAAAAALIVVLMFGLLRAPKDTIADNDHKQPAPQVTHEQNAPNAPHLPPKPELAIVPPREQPRSNWHPRAPEQPMPPRNMQEHVIAKHPAIADVTDSPFKPVEPATSPTTVAAALYTTGTAAHAIGDYETAYEAYSASYETEPNPQTLLAASDALLHLDAEDAGS